MLDDQNLETMMAAGSTMLLPSVTGALVSDKLASFQERQRIVGKDFYDALGE